jgi:hypothetical protein
MMFSDKATTNCPALFVPPQLPRPGVYQVPYEPKGQCREQKVTEKRRVPCQSVWYASPTPSLRVPLQERKGWGGRERTTRRGSK